MVRKTEEPWIVYCRAAAFEPASAAAACRARGMARGVALAAATVRARRSPAPLVFAVIVFAAIMAAMVRVILLLCEGRFVYALDDAYIHLAMARTLAESGVWGVTPHSTAFASSSPAWTLVLAALHAAGIASAATPLVLNVIAGVVLLVVVDRAARRLLRTDRARLWLLLAVVFTAPLPALVLSGMEAPWFVVCTVALVSGVAVAAAGDATPGGRRLPIGLMALAALTVGLRYEGLFVVAAAGVILAWGGRTRDALALWAAAFLPVVAYAALALPAGGYWLPTSVLLKAEPPSLGSGAAALGFLADKGVVYVFAHSAIAPLLVGNLVLLLVAMWRPGLRSVPTTWLLLVVATTLLHLQLLNFEWFYRYTAYLVVLGLLAAAWGLSQARDRLALDAPALRAHRPRYVLLLLLGAVLAGPLAVRSIGALSEAPRGSRAIYLQQVQMARFLSVEGTGPVLLNDIGAVAYYTRRPIVDLFGLATQRVAQLRRQGRFGTEEMDVLARESGAHVAVLYEERFTGTLAIPDSWRLVARWQSPERATIAHDTVAFFATSPERADPLRAALLAFAPSLPAAVQVVWPEP